MAANYDTDLVDKQQAALLNKSEGIVDGDDLTGVVQVATATYTLLGTETSGQTIQVTPEGSGIPIGAVILEDQITINAENPGTTLTGTLYLYNDDTQGRALGTALTLSSGGIIVNANAAGAVEPVETRIVANDGVRFYIASVDTLTTGQQIRFTIPFRSKA